MNEVPLPRRRLLALTGTAVAGGLAGCSGDAGGSTEPGGTTTVEEPTTSAPTTTGVTTTTTTTEETTTAVIEPALDAADQTTDGASVTVTRTTIDDAGWLVLYPEAEGGGPNAGVVLAGRMLEAGTYDDVVMEFGEPVSESRTLYAGLHYDDPADGEFTYPADGDPPVTVDGDPVVAAFALTVEGAGGGTTTVEMADTSFSPLRAAVEPGTTVEWVNRDPYGHDVVSGTFHAVAATWSSRSGRLGPGETVTYTFEEPGVYEYYCSIHGRTAMCGAVLVGDVTLDERLPCE